MNEPEKQQLVRVLAIQHADRVDLYTDGNVAVRKVQALHMESAAGELAAERMIDLQLPWNYRQVFVPGNLITSVQQRRVWPSDYVRLMNDLALLQALQKEGTG